MSEVESEGLVLWFKDGLKMVEEQTQAHLKYVRSEEQKKKKQ